MEFLVKSTKTEQVGFTDVTDKLETINSNVIDRLETINKGIMKRLEEMNPLFVSMFAMFADVALSTSARIAKHRETIYYIFPTTSVRIEPHRMIEIRLTRICFRYTTGITMKISIKILVNTFAILD